MMPSSLGLETARSESKSPSISATMRVPGRARSDQPFNILCMSPCAFATASSSLRDSAILR